MKFSHLFFAALCTALISPAWGALTALSGGGGNLGSGSSVLGNNFVAELSFTLPTTFPANPNRVLFEGGGNGLGMGVYLIGNDLVLYQDQNSGGDIYSTIDVSTLTGQYVTIRIDGDYSQAAGSDFINLSVLAADGTVLSTTNTGLNYATTFGGGDGTAVGYAQGTLGGNNERADIIALDNGGAWLSGGANALSALQITGELNTGTMADMQRELPITSPFAWARVPEPSRAILLGLGLLSIGLRRRR